MRVLRWLVHAAPMSTTSTSRVTGDVLLVGSMPFETAEEAMRLSGEKIGPYVPSPPRRRDRRPRELGRLPPAADLLRAPRPRRDEPSRGRPRAARARRVRGGAPRRRRRPALDVPGQARRHGPALRRPRLRALRDRVLRGVQAPARRGRRPRPACASRCRCRPRTARSTAFLEDNTQWPSCTPPTSTGSAARSARRWR